MVLALLSGNPWFLQWRHLKHLGVAFMSRNHCFEALVMSQPCRQGSSQRSSRRRGLEFPKSWVVSFWNEEELAGWKRGFWVSPSLYRRSMARISQTYESQNCFFLVQNHGISGSSGSPTIEPCQLFPRTRPLSWIPWTPCCKSCTPICWSPLDSNFLGDEEVLNCGYFSKKMVKFAG